MLIQELIPNVNLEDEQIEFKKIILEGKNNRNQNKNFEENWLSELVGFANSLGGVMYIGVDDSSHEVIPFDHQMIDNMILMIHRNIKTHIEPKLDYKIFSIPIPNTLPLKHILGIRVEKSKMPPVILKINNYGFIYVRHFGITNIATSEEIRNLVLNSDNISYDKTFTDEVFDKQDFTILYQTYEKNVGKALDEKELISCGFMSIDKFLSKGALLFKDDYDSQDTLVDCTQYLGYNKSDDVFYYSKKISKNLLSELDEIKQFVLSRTANGFIKDKDKHVNLISYPERSLTEAIINALGHRNYFINGSQIEVNLYKNRLEIISPGSLLSSKWLNKETKLSLIPPLRRNEVICNILTLCKLMEEKGSGFDKIESEYREYGEKYAPYASSDDQYFSLTLFDLAGNGEVGDEEIPNVYVEGILNGKNDLKILGYCYLKAHTISEISSFLNLKPSTYFRKNVIERLVNEGYLLKVSLNNLNKYVSSKKKVFLG